jgi:hypothetical protein
MSIQDCINRVVTTIEAKRTLSAEEKAEIKKIAEELDFQVGEVKAAKTPQEIKIELDKLKDLLAEKAENLSNSKVTFLNDVVKTTALKDRLNTKARKADGTWDVKKVKKELYNILEGDNSVDSTQRSLNNKTSTLLSNGLKENNVEKIALSGEIDKQTFVAMYEDGLGRTPNVTDPNVKGFMAAISKANDFIHAATVNAGVKIGYRKGYILKQGNYDPAKINTPDFVTDMVNSIDLDASFSKSRAEAFRKNPETLEKFFKEMQDEYLNPPVADLSGKAPNKSYKDKLKKRTLIFKDGEGAWGIESKYGQEGLLAHKLESQIKSNSTFIANSQVLGVQPAVNMARVLDYAVEGIADKNTRDIIIRDIAGAFTNVVAPPHSPTTHLTKFANTMRAMSAFTKLGSSVFTAGYDIIPSALQYSSKTGAPIIQSFAKSIETFVNVGLKDLSSKVVGGENLAKQVDDILGLSLHVDPLINMGLSSNNAKNYLGEKTNKFLRGFSKFTGTPLQTMYSKTTNAINHAVNFEKIVAGERNPYQVENIIKKYGFTEGELKLMNGLERKKVDKYALIDPSDVFKLDMPAQDAQALFFKYSNYIDDVVHKGTPQPTAQTKRHLGMGYNKDQTTRDIAKLVMQFKETAWKLVMSNKEALEEINTVGGKGRVATSAAEMAVVSAITYMGIETARASLFGRPSPMERLKDKDYQKLAFDYINKAAFAPVFSDLLETGYSGRPGAAAEYLLGPNFAVGKDLGKVAATSFDALVGEGDAEDAFKEMLKFTKRNVLPSNWFPLKAAEGLLLEHDAITGRKFK